MADPTTLPAYKDSLQSAIDRAFRDREATIMIYADDETVYVRAAPAVRPIGAKVVHAIQFWSADDQNETVQIRSYGARSKFVTRPIDAII